MPFKACLQGTTPLTGPQRPALVGDELLVWQANQTSGSLINTGSAASGNMSAYGSVAYQQATGSFSKGVIPNNNSYFYGANGVSIPTNALTVSCWVKLSATLGGFDTQCFIEKLNASSFPIATLGTGFGFSNAFMFRTTTATGGYIYRSVAMGGLGAGSIVFLALTIDNAGNLKCYVNGIEKTSFIAQSGTPSGNISVTGTDFWTIGLTGGSTAQTTSTVWEVRINPSILSAATLLAQYNQGAGI